MGMPLPPPGTPPATPPGGPAVPPPPPVGQSPTPPWGAVPDPAMVPAATPPPPPPGFSPTLPAGYMSSDPPAMGQLAGFWIRFASWLIDGILYGLVLALFLVPATLLGVNAFDGCTVEDDNFNDTVEVLCPPGAPDGGLIASAIALGVLGLLVVLFIYVRALGRGQTWGMRICSIRLVRSDNGQPVGFGKALGRSLFANFISANVFYLGYLWAAWDDQKQTWQDKIVSSYVVRA